MKIGHNITDTYLYLCNDVVLIGGEVIRPVQTPPQVDAGVHLTTKGIELGEADKGGAYNGPSSRGSSWTKMTWVQFRNVCNYWCAVGVPPEPWTPFISYMGTISIKIWHVLVYKKNSFAEKEKYKYF